MRAHVRAGHHPATRPAADPGGALAKLRRLLPLLAPGPIARVVSRHLTDLVLALVGGFLLVQALLDWRDPRLSGSRRHRHDGTIDFT